MKTIIIVMAILLTGTAGLAQAKHDTTHTHHPGTAMTKYTCPMHPKVVKTKPGKCPMCGMPLVAMKKKTAKTGKAMGGMKM